MPTASPIATSSGRYGTVQSHNSLTVTYERVGAVTRYSDGVIVDFAGLDSADNALFPCPACYLGVEGYGNTSITGALFADDLTEARIAISGVDQLHTGEDDGALRFVGAMIGSYEAGMIAWLPVAGAPDAPTESAVPGAATGETAAQVWDATRAAADDPLREASSGPPIGRIAAALILSAMWVLLVAWIVYRIAAARRTLAEDRPDTAVDRDAAFSPPSDLEPALVAVVVGDAGPGERSAVAATLLGLAHRGVIRIDGIDSERYTLTIPPGARGATTFEEAALSELRPQGMVTATATLTGPPLWGGSGRSIGRTPHQGRRQGSEERPSAAGDVDGVGVDPGIAGDGNRRADRVGRQLVARLGGHVRRPGAGAGGNGAHRHQPHRQGPRRTRAMARVRRLAAHELAAAHRRRPRCRHLGRAARVRGRARRGAEGGRRARLALSGGAGSSGVAARLKGGDGTGFGAGLNTSGKVCGGAE